MSGQPGIRLLLWVHGPDCKFCSSMYRKSLRTGRARRSVHHSSIQYQSKTGGLRSWHSLPGWWFCMAPRRPRQPRCAPKIPVVGTGITSFRWYIDGFSPNLRIDLSLVRSSCVLALQVRLNPLMERRMGRFCVHVGRSNASAAHLCCNMRREVEHVIL